MASWTATRRSRDLHRAASTRPVPLPGPGGRIIGARLVKRQRLTEHESGFLRQHVDGAPYKVTMPAASYVVARGYKPGVTDKVYADRKAALDAAVAIIREEIEALLAEGTPYIQLDNPHYPDYVDEERCEQWRRIGIDPDEALLEDVEADNASLRGFHGPNVTLAMHFCRGNSAGGGWHTSGGYDRIAEPVFSGLDVDTFLLEYDSERAGTFEPLRHMPKGKTVTLGLVTTKAAALESQDQLLRRIDEASRFVATEDLALSPQCGFASTLQGNPLTEDDELRKLELVVDTATKVWGAIQQP